MGPLLQGARHSPCSRPLRAQPGARHGQPCLGAELLPAHGTRPHPAGGCCGPVPLPETGPRSHRRCPEGVFLLREPAWVQADMQLSRQGVMLISTNEPERGAAPDPGPLCARPALALAPWAPAMPSWGAGGGGSCPSSPLPPMQPRTRRAQARLTSIYPGNAVSSSAAPGARMEAILARGFLQPDAPLLPLQPDAPCLPVPGAFSGTPIAAPSPSAPEQGAGGAGHPHPAQTLPAFPPLPSR